VRQFDTFVKNQRRFHAAVGEKNAAAALRQVVSVFCHCNRLRDRKASTFR
jgi:hypothetical protein